MPRFEEAVEIQEGDLIIEDALGNAMIRLNFNNARIVLGGDAGPGRDGRHGDISLRRNNGVETILLDARHGNLTLGAVDHDGDILIRDSHGEVTAHLNGDNGHIRLGAGPGDMGIGTNGDMSLRSNDGVQTVYLNGEHGNLTLGAVGHDGDITIKNSRNDTTIHLDGDSGDITLSNADLAEDFDVSTAAGVKPGTVVVLGKEGRLQPSVKAYDTRVAGVISGAGEMKPGIVLDKRASSQSRLPVALVGKTFCKVDAQYAPIEVGDLLTTSPTEGHGMKASEPSRAFGAVLGKALRPLACGQGMIPIMVTLQ